MGRARRAACRVRHARLPDLIQGLEAKGVTRLYIPATPGSEILNFYARERVIASQMTGERYPPTLRDAGTGSGAGLPVPSRGRQPHADPQGTRRITGDGACGRLRRDPPRAPDGSPLSPGSRHDPPGFGVPRKSGHGASHRPRHGLGVGERPAQDAGHAGGARSGETRQRGHGPSLEPWTGPRLLRDGASRRDEPGRHRVARRRHAVGSGLLLLERAQGVPLGVGLPVGGDLRARPGPAHPDLPVRGRRALSLEDRGGLRLRGPGGTARRTHGRDRCPAARGRAGPGPRVRRPVDERADIASPHEGASRPSHPSPWPYRPSP